MQRKALGGSLSCPVILNPDGSAYADITDIGEAVLFLQRQIATTTSALQSLQAHQTQAKSKGAFWRKKNSPPYSSYHQQTYGPAPTNSTYAPNYNNQGYPAPRQGQGNPGGDPHRTRDNCEEAGGQAGVEGESTDYKQSKLFNIPLPKSSSILIPFQNPPQKIKNKETQK